MLTSLNRMVGLPVIWQDRQLGYVERAVPDPTAKRLAGVVVRKGIGSAKWLPSDAILVAGAQCVLARRKPMRMAEGDAGNLRQAFLTTGESAGEVTDAIILGDTLKMAALEVSPGPVYHLLGKRAYAVDFRVDRGTRPGEVVVSHLLTWAQLRRTLGEEDGR